MQIENYHIETSAPWFKVKRALEWYLERAHSEYEYVGNYLPTVINDDEEDKTAWLFYDTEANEYHVVFVIGDNFEDDDFEYHKLLDHIILNEPEFTKALKHLDTPIRVDTIALLVMGSDRAMVKHHVNVGV